MQKKRFPFVDMLKAIAVLLVINSHFDKLYPIAALGTGGSLGNGLFFAVSGFCLWPIGNDFRTWMSARVRRLYLPVWLMTAAVLLTTSRHLLSLSNVFFIFAWPTMFWFVGGILLFYFLGFLLRNVTEKSQFTVLFSVLLGLYILGYLRMDTSVWSVESTWSIDHAGLHKLFAGSFKLIYDFAMFMAGRYLRLHMDTPAHRPSYYVANITGGYFSLRCKVSHA